ncbi:hypothetical protein [Paenochrobactrum glaciei]|uniref:Uncharacterized protein n=1 Tax=Paenochrobactrum glaciei TaxID=486407 RepID=A0ABN1FEA7_9HYPH
MALDINEASTAIGMINRGDKQHDVAAWFGVNQARIAEATQGHFGTTTAAPLASLPPSGAPGIKGRRLKNAVDAVITKLNAGNSADALADLQAATTQFEADE